MEILQWIVGLLYTLPMVLWLVNAEKCNKFIRILFFAFRLALTFPFLTLIIDFMENSPLISSMFQVYVLICKDYSFGMFTLYFTTLILLLIFTFKTYSIIKNH
jgi:hypothetical protein